MSYPNIERSIRPAGYETRVVRYESRPRSDGTHTLAKALGWFSLGLGLTEVLMPRRLGRAIGVGDHPTLMPLLGLREIVSGIGILAQSDPTNSVRARVAGDVMDLALLGSALYSARDGRRRRDDERSVRIASATAAVLGVTALDLVCAAQLSRRQAQPGAKRKGTIAMTKSIAINKPVSELYTYWRELGNLPRVMRHLESVAETSGNRSHWIARGPAGATFEWDAQITTEVPDEVIAWQSLPGSEVPNQGYVDFKPLPAGRGSVVTVHLQYDPPGGLFGAKLAKLFGRSPEQEVEQDLRRWKQIIETGEFATTEGQPHGKRSVISKHLP